MPPDQPLPNAPEARTPEGEIRNASTLLTEPKAALEPKLAEGDKPKADEGKTLLTEKTGDKSELTAGAPDKYTDFTVPEGFTLDPAVATEFGGIAKELNLTQANAQRLIDFHVAKTTESANAPYEAYKAMKDDWAAKVRADPDIGGKLDQVKTVVARAIDGLGDAKLAVDFREVMDLTGVGNHPAFVKAFYKLAQKVSEGTRVPGGGPAKVLEPGAARPSIAGAMYPTLKQG